MLMKRSLAFGLILAAGGALLAPGAGSFPKLTGPFLGQKPPGMTPELFAPGIVGTGLMERDVAVSPDGKEIYFGLAAGSLMTIMRTRLRDGAWTEPEIAPFAVDQAYYHFEPALSPDGKRIYFLSNRPPKGKDPKPGWTHQNIWAADRTADGSWGEPYEPDPVINAGATQFFPSAANDGTLYFTRSAGKPPKLAIYRSRSVNGHFAEAEKLPDVINGQGTPYNACIAPDESYLVACIEGRPCEVNPGAANYFVFFRAANDAWSEGIPLGPEVNIKGSTAMSPYVTSDGRYFFFAAQKTDPRFLGSTKGRTLSWLLEMGNSVQNGDYDIYWVKAEVIGTLRPRK
jgi:ribosomal protein L24E